MAEDIGQVLEDLRQKDEDDRLGYLLGDVQLEQQELIDLEVGQFHDSRIVYLAKNVDGGHLDDFREILELIAERDRSALLTTQDDNGNIAIVQLANNEEEALLIGTALTTLSPNQRLSVLCVEDGNGETALTCMEGVEKLITGERGEIDAGVLTGDQKTDLLILSHKGKANSTSLLSRIINQAANDFSKGIINAENIKDDIEGLTRDVPPKRMDELFNDVKDINRMTVYEVAEGYEKSCPEVLNVVKKVLNDAIDKVRAADGAMELEDGGDAAAPRPQVRGGAIEGEGRLGRGNARVPD